MDGGETLIILGRSVPVHAPYPRACPLAVPKGRAARGVPGVRCGLVGAAGEGAGSGREAATVRSAAQRAPWRWPQSCRPAANSENLTLIPRKHQTDPNGRRSAEPPASALPKCPNGTR